MISDPEILNLFGRQHGHAHVHQLEDIGVDKHRRARLRRNGLMSSPAPGVLRLSGVPLSFEGRAMGAQLAAGHDARLTGFTAGSLLGARMMPREQIEVMVRRPRQPRLPADAVLHRSRWFDVGDDRLQRADGLVVTSPLRTLFALAGMCSPQQLARAGEDMWRTGLLTPDDAERYLEDVRGRGRTGVTALTIWLEQVAGRARPTGSGAEFDLLPHLAAAGLPTPSLQHEVTLPTGVVIHLDIAWPEALLDVEPGHSVFHTGEALRRDYERDNLLSRLGWQVMRFDEVQQRAPRWCAMQVAEVYRTRRALLRAAGDAAVRQA